MKKAARSAKHEAAFPFQQCDNAFPNSDCRDTYVLPCSGIERDFCSHRRLRASSLLFAGRLLPRCSSAFAGTRGHNALISFAKTLARRATLIRIRRTSVQIPMYTPRYFGRLDTWRFSNWSIKAYGISTRAPERKQVLEPRLVDEARLFVKANLARMEETPHYSVGFVVIHHGSSAKSLLTQWWVNECVCMQHVAQSEYSGQPKFSAAKPDFMACAYELAAIDFERRAWVSTVMAGKSMEDYLGAWLPDGFY